MRWPFRQVPAQPPSSTARVEELAKRIEELANEIANATEALRQKGSASGQG